MTMTAYEAYEYARDIVKGKYPDGEEAISKSPYYSYAYAMYILEGRFPQGEKAISSEIEYLLDYNAMLRKKGEI